MEKATSQVISLYAGKSQAAETELQFAIYPWKGSPGEVMLEITSDAGELVTRDSQGTGFTFRAKSPEALVEAAERYVPDTSKAMFGWVRRISQLT